MFNPSRADARLFFFETWRKYRSQLPLEGLERTAIEVILLHPEHQALLDDPLRNLDRGFAPESGTINPFLHLSLHLLDDSGIGGIRGGDTYCGNVGLIGELP